jgi:hypothetical protein
MHRLLLMLSMAMMLGFPCSANSAEVIVLSDGPLEPALTKLAESFRTELRPDLVALSRACITRDHETAASINSMLGK